MILDFKVFGISIESEQVQHLLILLCYAWEESQDVRHGSVQVLYDLNIVDI